MYKVYLSPALDKNATGKKEYGYDSVRMGMIADSIEQELINDGKYLVFRNMEDMTTDEIIEDSNSIKPNAHIAIHTRTGKNTGIEIEVKQDNAFSMALGREVNKKLREIHYIKTENIIKYEKTSKEIADTTSPAIKIYLGNRDNQEDVSWIISQKNEIGVAIAEGIQEYFGLKKC